MTIIQNVACIEATINPSFPSIMLNNDILSNKKILGVYVFGSDPQTIINFPSTREPLIDFISNGNLSLYLNLKDVKLNHFIKDLGLKNYQLFPNIGFQPYMEQKIDRVIDIDSFLITEKSVMPVANYNLLIYVFYQSKNFTPFNDRVNGLETITIPKPNIMEDALLSNYINKKLEGKKIKKIIATGDVYGYLDIICKDNANQIENLPLSLLSVRDTKEFYFDDIEIDFERSFLKCRDELNMDYPSVGYTNLTFIY